MSGTFVPHPEKLTFLSPSLNPIVKNLACEDLGVGETTGLTIYKMRVVCAGVEVYPGFLNHLRVWPKSTDCERMGTGLFRDDAAELDDCSTRVFKSSEAAQIPMVFCEAFALWSTPLRGKSVGVVREAMEALRLFVSKLSPVTHTQGQQRSRPKEAISVTFSRKVVSRPC